MQKSSTTSELVNFVSFNKFIEDYLEKVKLFSHRLINEADHPQLVSASREWLIRNVGCFSIAGYFKTPELSYWFDYETIIQEFDELLLMFRTYLNQEKAIDTTLPYTLTRYQDNLTFIMVEGELKQNALSIITAVDPIDELWPEFEKEFLKLEKNLTDKLGHKVDIAKVFNELLWDGNGLHWKVRENIKTEE